MRDERPQPEEHLSLGGAVAVVLFLIFAIGFVAWINP
jgi:preprotein translocase subunit Sss1